MILLLLLQLQLLLPQENSSDTFPILGTPELLSPGDNKHISEIHISFKTNKLSIFNMKEVNTWISKKVYKAQEKDPNKGNFVTLVREEAKRIDMCLSDHHKQYAR